MIQNQRTNENDKIVWQDPLLQILMGQWFEILPSTDKKYSLLNTYQIPKKPEDYLEKDFPTIKKQKQIDQECVKLLNLFGLQDSFFVLTKWNQEENSFLCYMKDTKKKATIQFLFQNFITYPSDFIVSFEGVKTTYHFITIKDQKENKLVSIEREDENGMIQTINKESYQLRLSTVPISIFIEYKKSLKEIEDVIEMVDTKGLKEKIRSSNLEESTSLNLYHIVYQILLKPMEKYHYVMIDTPEEKLEWIALKDHTNMLRINNKWVNIEKDLEKKRNSYDYNKMKKIQK